VELTHFHKVRTAVQTNARPGGSADLTVAKARVRQGLVDTGWFEDVEVAATDDVDNLVVAMCTFPAQLTSDRVAQRLAVLWEDRLRYPFWAAHATLVDADQVELEGATRSSTRGHYLTVHLLAERVTSRGREPAPVVPLPVVPAQRSRS
jgi:hypothetical protein